MSGWKRLAVDVAELAAAAGERVVVLENETAIAGYAEGKYSIDLDRLRQAVAQLPAGIEIWWYPGIGGEAEDRQEREEAILRAIDAGCRPRFTSFHLQSPAALDYHWTRQCVVRQERFARQPYIPMVYFGWFDAIPNVQWWPYERAADVLALVRSDIVFFYPDAVRWVETARGVTEALRASESRRP